MFLMPIIHCIFEVIIVPYLFAYLNPNTNFNYSTITLQVPEGSCLICIAVKQLFF